MGGKKVCENKQKNGGWERKSLHLTILLNWPQSSVREEKYVYGKRKTIYEMRKKLFRLQVLTYMGEIAGGNSNQQGKFKRKF